MTKGSNCFQHTVWQPLGQYPNAFSAESHSVGASMHICQGRSSRRQYALLAASSRASSIKNLVEVAASQLQHTL